MTPTTPSGPLSGIRVIDLSTVVFGPYGTQILADLGADVIKIETADGDNIRSAGASPTGDLGPIFVAMNRNKRSVVLDLKSAAGRAAMNRLIAGADVFFHNIRLQGIERLGFGYEAVRALREDIVYVHCTGYGAGGAYGGLQAYDDLVQAATGAASLMSRADGDPTPRYVPTLIADKTAGLHAAYATLAALFHRQRTGEGQYVDIPMFEAFASWHLLENLFGKTWKDLPYQTAYPRTVARTRKPYRTQDGYIAILPYLDAHWQRFFEIAGRTELFADPRFSSYKARSENFDALYGEIDAVAGERTTAEWLAALQEAGVPCMPVHDLDDVLEDPHLSGSGFFERRTHPDGGEYVAMQPPVRFTGTATGIYRDPPRHGEHTVEVLEELGYSRAEAESLAAAAASRAAK